MRTFDSMPCNNVKGFFFFFYCLFLYSYICHAERAARQGGTPWSTFHPFQENPEPLKGGDCNVK